MLNNKSNRATFLSSMVLTTLLSLFSIGGLSLLFFNSITIPVKTHSTTTHLSNDWQLIKLDRNNFRGQIASYFGIPTQFFKQYLPGDILAPTEKLGISLVNGQRTFQQVLIFMFDYPVSISSGLARPLTSPINIGPAKPTVAINHNHFVAVEQLQPGLHYVSSTQEHINPKVYLQLRTLFGNITPLDTHLRQTQRFNALYDRAGHLLLATITVHNHTYQAIRYTDSKKVTSYYTPNGKSLLTSAFLKAPLHYTRISDGYTLHRWHPILHLYRPHYGIDFAAPAGTPIHAIASGQVRFAGWGGGYGNAIVIKHNSRYQSLYAHLSHFAATVKPGQHVHQGDIIGYVGSTGLATGPHLHFGIYQYGKPINPELVLAKSQFPAQVNKRDLPNFLATTNHLLTQLAYAQNHNIINA
ncbi:MAG: M23 family metallopeptidase [Proteobacteria bacterium]|nr:M23 family metallopeptidase [Pseudomonadota bacterium]